MTDAAAGEPAPGTAAAASPAAEVPVRPAATIMLVRPAAAADGARSALEVFMLRRTGNAAFGAGMFVFPGGRVDAADSAAETVAVCDGRDDARASAELGLDGGGLAYWVAAVRECLEEAGVLLAMHRSGGPIELGDDVRRLVHAGTLGVAELCAARDWILDLAHVEYVAHWVTPRGEAARRFDTRFFVAEAPPGQEPVHDDSETVASMWITPAQAIEMFRAGDITMMPPTLSCLEWLAAFDTPAAALAAGRDLAPQRILPKLRLGPDGAVVGVSLPGDADYDQLPD